MNHFKKERSVDHLVLAGGGHSHVLVLLRWAKKPSLRPKGLITLINRNSTTIYSGMVPGVVSGNYCLEQAQIDLRKLTQQIHVSLIIGEIESLDIQKRNIVLKNRSVISFQRISLNIGSETNTSNFVQSEIDAYSHMPIKPFEKSIKWLENFDSYSRNKSKQNFAVIGGGFAGIELIFALRKRWPNKNLILQVKKNKLSKKLLEHLSSLNIQVLESQYLPGYPALVCTGNKPPDWIKSTGLSLDNSGRIITLSSFQTLNYPYIFAVGDCAVIQNAFRPASGVWAVRAAINLSKNLERDLKIEKSINWKPQSKALQLVSSYSSLNKDLSWASWGKWMIGPNRFFWILKKILDEKFITMFRDIDLMNTTKNSYSDMDACRGCAAKLSSHPLRMALREVGLKKISAQPEDASEIIKLDSGETLIQSVDGFPSLVSDLWLNARITTLHACSDIWASGGFVQTAQPIISIPYAPESIQKEILAQILGGIKSALDEQNASIIGGHTIETRNHMPYGVTTEVDISISVNGIVPKSKSYWKKSGLKKGDVILLSRSLGSGCIFAAAMKGKIKPHILDNLCQTMNQSQHTLLNDLIRIDHSFGHTDSDSCIHACTDITGFGLLGHLSEMLFSSNELQSEKSNSLLKIILDGHSIPSYPGVFKLLSEGYFSTLSPSNRQYWEFFKPNSHGYQPFELKLDEDQINLISRDQIMELLVDPQTCGPLALACTPEFGERLASTQKWIKIGLVVGV